MKEDTHRALHQIHDVAEETVSGVALDVVDCIVESCAESELRQAVLSDIWEAMQATVLNWIGVVLPDGKEN